MTMALPVHGRNSPLWFALRDKTVVPLRAADTVVAYILLPCCASVVIMATSSNVDCVGTKEGMSFW